MKLITDDSNPNFSCSSDAIGKISFSELIDPSNQLKTVNFIFYMTDVVRQKDEQYENILSLMRNVTLKNEKFEFLINRFLFKVNKNNKYIFMRLFILLHN